MKTQNRQIPGGIAFLAVFLLLVAGTSTVWGQAGRGMISGTITDPSGAIVPGAKVTLLNPATGVELHTATTGAGLYTFISLNPGSYEVTASQSGFTTSQRENVIVTVDQTTIVDIALKVGSVSTVVKVNEETNLVEPSNSTVGQLISAATIDRVPLLNRDVYDLTQLSPGVTPANGTPNSSNS